MQSNVGSFFSKQCAILAIWVLIIFSRVITSNCREIDLFCRVWLHFKPKSIDQCEMSDQLEYYLQFFFIYLPILEMNLEFLRF